jgi:hypothetical protein
MEENRKATIALFRRFSGRCNLWKVDVIALIAVKISSTIAERIAGAPNSAM